jgi:hypothetical protein
VIPRAIADGCYEACKLAGPFFRRGFALEEPMPSRISRMMRAIVSDPASPAEAGFAKAGPLFGMTR